MEKKNKKSTTAATSVLCSVDNTLGIHRSGRCLVCRSRDYSIFPLRFFSALISNESSLKKTGMYCIIVCFVHRTHSSREKKHQLEKCSPPGGKVNLCSTVLWMKALPANWFDVWYKIAKKKYIPPCTGYQVLYCCCTWYNIIYIYVYILCIYLVSWK